MDKEKAIFKSLEIIEARIAEKLTVGNISGSIYFSKYHYQRLFREIVGDSVMDYVMKRKLTLAGRELLETDNSVLDVALKFGYDSHEGFTRSFKAYMGVTPTEYRRYNLASISQNLIIVKERLNMYSKNTDEIIRELNDFIAKSKEIAKLARKIEIPGFAQFWNAAADITDEIADKVKNMLERTAVGRPDEITSLFNIVKTIDDTAYKLNMLAFNAAVTVARGVPEQIEAQKNLCDKYREFAFFSAKKSVTVHHLLNELSTLIFKDMRKTAEEKIQAFVKKCGAVTEKMAGYIYLQEELTNFSSRISAIPCEELTMHYLESRLLQLDAVSFSVMLDMRLRDPDNTLPDDLFMLKDNFAETVDFFRTLAKLEKDNPPQKEKSDADKCLMALEDIAFMGNIILFYTKAELAEEKLGRILSAEQKAGFNEICDKMSEFTQFSVDSKDLTGSLEKFAEVFKKIADMTKEIYQSMKQRVNKLELNCSMLVIAEELEHLSDKVAACSREVLAMIKST